MDDQSGSRTVILLRHGKSSWSDSTLADIDRPLAPRGERALRKLAKYIRRERIRPALVLCSSALRTRQTLEAVEASLGKPCVVEVVPQLEEKFPTGALATLVVHNTSWGAIGPGVAELVDYVVPRQLG